MAQMNPQMAKYSMTGGGFDKVDGSRPNRIAGVKDVKTLSGAPKGKTQQRGHKKTPI